MADTSSRDGTTPSERADAPRTAAYLREHGNHLRDEPSLYLQTARPQSHRLVSLGQDRPGARPG